MGFSRLERADEGLASAEYAVLGAKCEGAPDVVEDLLAVVFLAERLLLHDPTDVIVEVVPFEVTLDAEDSPGSVEIEGSQLPVVVAFLLHVTVIDIEQAVGRGELRCCGLAVEVSDSWPILAMDVSVLGVGWRPIGV